MIIRKKLQMLRISELRHLLLFFSAATFKAWRLEK